ITHGLPRIQELFEARTPAGFAPISEFAGRAEIEENDKQRRITVTPDDGSDPVSYTVSKRVTLLIADGDHIDVGQQLTQGSVDPKQVLRILGPRKVSSTWWTRCRRCTSARVWTSTPSTSRSSCARCSVVSRSSSPATPICCP